MTKDREIRALLGLTAEQYTAYVTSQGIEYGEVAIPEQLRCAILSTHAYWEWWWNTWRAADALFVAEETDSWTLLPDGPEGAETTFAGVFGHPGLLERYMAAHNPAQINRASLRRVAYAVNIPLR